MITDHTTTMGATVSDHYFVRHFFEMLIAMLVGMAMLGLLVSGIFRLLGHANLLHYAALRAVLMATYMSIGMSLWMRRRGHSWLRTGEMAGAMYAPFLVLLVPFWTGLVSAGVLLIGGHLLMLPTMLRTMLYRREVLAGSSTSFPGRAWSLTQGAALYAIRAARLPSALRFARESSDTIPPSCHEGASRQLFGVDGRRVSKVTRTFSGRGRLDAG
jgi:hypothetical protein